MENYKEKSSDPASVKTGELSKAEARAKRKEAKKVNKGKKDKQSISDSHIVNTQPVLSNEKLSEKNIPAAIDKKDNKLLEEKSEIIIEDVKEKSDSTQLSKSELKAQRRAIQEAQRLKKTNEKLTKEQNTTNENKTVSVENTKSKAELKAERRAIQEAQRAAKSAAQNEKVKQHDKLKVLPKTDTNKDKELINKEQIKLKKPANIPDSLTTVTASTTHKKLQLFHHLDYQYNTPLTKELSYNLHSSIIRLGIQYMSHTILGSNARCLALLSAIKQLVQDYHTPPNEEFCRSLESNLQQATIYLQKCRPLAVSMTNALRHIKLHLTQITNNISDNEKKEKLIEGIDIYIKDEIGMADKAISLFVEKKICNGDVILVYGCSSVVYKILLDAHKKEKLFKVIIVDSRPLLEGREMLRKLVNAGMNCSYVFINAVSYIMSKSTKVLLGAHSLLANGYVMSRTGTAQIALIAQSYNKPVLVCCETYKFCERVQTDSIVHNEIGDPDQILNMADGEESPLKCIKNSKYVTLLNLMYDVTPPDLVTAVVTELAILPCTSVPVVLRIKPTEIAL